MFARRAKRPPYPPHVPEKWRRRFQLTMNIFPAICMPIGAGVGALAFFNPALLLLAIPLIGVFIYSVSRIELSMRDREDFQTDWLARLLYRNAPHVDLRYAETRYLSGAKFPRYGMHEKYGWTVYEDRDGCYILSRLIARSVYDIGDVKVYLHRNGHVQAARVPELRWEPKSGECPLFEEWKIQQVARKIR